MNRYDLFRLPLREFDTAIDVEAGVYTLMLNVCFVRSKNQQESADDEGEVRIITFVSNE